MFLTMILKNAFPKEDIDLMQTAVFVDGIRRTSDVLLQYNAYIHVEGKGPLWVTTGASR